MKLRTILLSALVFGLAGCETIGGLGETLDEQDEQQVRGTIQVALGLYLGACSDSKPLDVCASDLDQALNFSDDQIQKLKSGDASVIIRSLLNDNAARLGLSDGQRVIAQMFLGRVLDDVKIPGEEVPWVQLEDILAIVRSELGVYTG